MSVGTLAASTVSLSGGSYTTVIVVALIALLAVPGTPLWLLFAILFVSELFTPLFDSARMASIPDVLGTPSYVAAGTGLSRALNLINQAVGLFVGGLVVQLTTPRVALFLDALSFVFSFAVLAVTLRDRPSELESTPSIRVLMRDLAEGWSMLMADPSRRAFVLLSWALAAPLVAPEAVALAYADSTGEVSGWGGALILFAGLFDMMDGRLARVTGMSSKFGALYDSVLDRYSELFMFLGICFYLSHQDYFVSSVFTFLAMIGSLMVSYVRARAEGLGIECSDGLMQRPERILLIGISAIICGLVTHFYGHFRYDFPNSNQCLFENISLFTTPLKILAVLANWTAWTRLQHCRRVLSNQ